MLFSVFLPLAEITFLTPPRSSGGTSGEFELSPVVLAVLAVTALVAIRVLRSSLRGSRPPRRRNTRKPRKPRHDGRSATRQQSPKLRNPILVDGSNVMHWKDDTPQIMPVQSVVNELKRRGFTPGVVFDANAGYKLAGKYMNEREFAYLLDLPESQVFVVPKGTPADPYLLDAARGFAARVVTLDRFRDWAEAHPEVKEPGFLIRGGYRNTGEFWLAEAEAAPVAAVTTAN
jgi:hypothetical protein